jgi:alpha-tubulin suppressor-like RCC1 family protein
MIRGGILNSRARPVRRSVPAVARALAGTAVAAVGGLAVSLATGVVPALAAQHPGGPAASQTRADARGQHSTAGRMSPGTPWARIAAGGDHTCGIRTDGTLWCWGDNASGELGLGNHTGQDRPRQVTTPAAGGWASITAGTFYTCATRTGGTLWCWGDNDSGALGLGPGGGAGQDLPRQVTTPARGGWAYVTAGGEDTCGIRTDATLWCWGNNWEGQLGIGNELSQGRPRQVTTPTTSGWASVTTAGDHTCATRTGGTLWCWGSNSNGQLGLGDHSGHDRPRQVTIPTTGGWASVTAGGQDTCAIRTGGTLWCWGYGYYGQLGIGNHKGECHPQQVTVPATGGWASIDATGYYTCATRADGTLWCWGSNYSGELGIGGDTDQELPRQVTTPATGGWAGVTAGFDQTCATRTDGTLWCWGYNDNGELGIGNYTDQDRPRQVTG